jgi:hypothetical protein
MDSNLTEPVNESNILGSGSWNKTRSTEELLSFISRREAQIFAD